MRKTIQNCLLLGFSLLFFSPFAQAQNPILKGYADPHMKVWNGKNLIHYQMARLSEDMLSLAEPPSNLMTEAEFGLD
jgi:hypothetical protein